MFRISFSFILCYRKIIKTDMSAFPNSFIIIRMKSNNFWQKIKIRTQFQFYLFLPLLENVANKFGKTTNNLFVCFVYLITLTILPYAQNAFKCSPVLSKESTYSERDLGRSQSQEDSLEKGIATHSSILAWRMPWTEQPGWLQSM